MRSVSGRGWTMIHGDCLDVMRDLRGQSIHHIITDPPYDEHVHSKSWRGASLPDVAAQPCRTNRDRELGFGAITSKEMTLASAYFAELASRWTLVFSNHELSFGWRARLERYGLDYCRTGAWWKLRPAPQFTGDRPAAGFESITICHRRGRKRWNGGGRPGSWAFEAKEDEAPVYQEPVVQNCNGHRGERVHSAQKPDDLMLALIDDFTDVSEVVFDGYAGSGTTGVAALRRGRTFLGVERDAATFALACDRLRAEEQGLSLAAMRSGQIALFGSG